MTLTPQLEWSELESISHMGVTGEAWEADALGGELKFLITRNTRLGQRGEEWRCHVQIKGQLVGGVYSAAKTFDEAKQACNDYLRKFVH